MLLVFGLAGAAPAPSCVNFGLVTPGFYRGAEPSGPCLDDLARLGIRTVVNLRDDEEASDLERTNVAALGMRYISLPMSGFGRPSEIEVRRVLSVVHGPVNQPVFLHCRRGRDRTGVIVAAHRMSYERWPVQRALQEAKRYGLAWWQVRMKSFIRNFRSGPEESAPCAARTGTWLPAS